jgi:hypothetical protein
MVIEQGTTEVRIAETGEVQNWPIQLWLLNDGNFKVITVKPAGGFISEYYGGNEAEAVETFNMICGSHVPDSLRH